ncbi:MAG: acyl-CoA thioesterase [Pirellulales bacterium]|nr:acyl-CoA thioesterase [Pirellulales bacterium]
MRTSLLKHTHVLRIRYSETDQMGTYYHSRALEWFERGRTELCRATGTPYAEWERRGVMLPLVEAYVKYLGMARYDDQLQMTSVLSMAGKASMRFDVTVEHAETGRPVCCGHTIHAITDATGKPIRPPGWVMELIDPAGD